MIVGLWLFREKIDKWGWVAIGLAAIGVLFQTLALGRPPWISIVLALSFASYGVIRKRVPIDAQALPRLFDRFFRVEESRSCDNQQHHGLGLAIVAAIARMHDGRTVAESAGGTTRVGFTLAAA
jgi:light-regulated signal transduction histidine kinase (bacteriophytochrome)